jgi:hypothetical protein
MFDCKRLHMQSCYILCFFPVCFVLSKWNSSIAHAAVVGDHCVLLNLNVVHTKQTELWVRIYANRLVLLNSSKLVIHGTHLLAPLRICQSLL